MIVKTPGMVGGRPRIDGRRIKVQDIVVWRAQGYNTAQIIEDFGLTEAQIAAADAYYAANRGEIESDINSDADFIAQHPWAMFLKG